MKECSTCGFLNEWNGCDCPHYDKWYACPIENKKLENIQALKEYAEWLPQYEGEWVAESEDDDLLADSYCIDDYAGNEINIVDRMTVVMADAVIEADKTESEG